MDSRERRNRTLTSKGKENYDQVVANFNDKIRVSIQSIEQFISSKSHVKDLVDISVIEKEKHDLLALSNSYDTLHTEYCRYLDHTFTEESRIESYTLSIKDKAIRSKTELFLNELGSVIGLLKSKRRTTSERSEFSESVRSKHSVVSSTQSEISSILARKRAKAEAAKAKLMFNKEEAELRKKRSQLEEEKSFTVATAARRQVEIDIELDLLQDKKEVAAAEAEVRVLENVISEKNSDKNSDVFSGIPAADPLERVAEFVSVGNRKQDVPRSSVVDNVDTDAHSQIQNVRLDNIVMTNDSVDINHCNVTSCDKNNAMSARNDYVLANSNIDTTHNCMLANSSSVEPNFAVNFTKFLLRKELTLSRLNSFDDKCENYQSWKGTFCDVTRELNISSAEEIDLLIKWLGFESKRSALSLKVAHPNDPVGCLRRIWERLDERYGAAESVHHSVLSKLERFPRLGVKDTTKLYDLCDILSEIEALKENPRYSVILSYFDSSVGISPILSKLPFSMQEKWIAVASRYKRLNESPFPPFSVFTEFIREQTKIKNDPAFRLYDQERRVTSNSTGSGRKVVVNKTDLKNSEQAKVKEICPIHKSDRHRLGTCRTFQSKSFDEKRKILKENKLCYRCLSSEHLIGRCESGLKCNVCSNASHHTLLHVNRTLSVNGGEQVSPKCTEICHGQFGGKSCAKIVLVSVYSLSAPDKIVKVYALLDEQSNRTLAKPELFTLLGLEGKLLEYTLNSCSGSTVMSGRRANDCIVESLDGRVSYSLPTIIECPQIPDNRDEIPTPEAAAYYSHLQEIASSIPKLDENANILLLIGRDLLEAHHVLDQRLGPPGAPYAQRLSLGWVIVGETCLGKAHAADTVSVNKTFVLSNGRESLLKPCPSSIKVVENLETDVIGSDIFIKTSADEEVGLSVEDKMFLAMMDNEMFKHPSGYWSAPLPFRSPRQRLQSNRQQVFDRAKRLDASLRRNPVKLGHFVTFMKDIIESGHAEPAQPCKKSEVWYLPFFGVYHPKKKDQIRGVFDASAKFGNLSLNDVLLSGPDLMNSLLGILLRFRKEAVAVTADIQRMFYCFFVNEEHRDFLRFFWYKENDPKNELIEYRMCVHVFGNKPSPAVATYGLRKSVENSDLDVKNFVTENFYVDDGLISLPTPSEAIDLMMRTQKDLKDNGNLRLHKIASNSVEVLSSFPANDLAKNLGCFDLLVDDLPSQLSLGLQWHLELDSFVFRVTLDDKAFTRRGVLSVINSIYDPLGLIAPIVISGKLILKDLMQETGDWDKPLPACKQNEWDRWRNSLKSLEHLVIPRMYLPVSLSSTTRRELHIFSDASEKAIAAVVYLVAVSENNTLHKSFVLGKAKIAPKSGHTIPRLELCAAVLAVQLYEIVLQHLSVVLANVFFFVDSKVVLGYIKNKSRRFYTYVTNRIEKIHRSSNPDQWGYVKTDLNPADCATRPILASDLPGCLWLYGLSDFTPDIQSIGEVYPLVEPEDDKEVRPVVNALSTEVNVDEQLGSKRFERFSSWTNLVSAVGLLIHIARSFQKVDECSGWHVCSPSKLVECRRKAEQVIIFAEQSRSFPGEMKSLESGGQVSNSSSIIALSPILGIDRIVRVGGRLRKASLPVNEKNPIIIPKKCHLAVLLVRHYHSQVAHQGRHITEGAIRSAGYWIVGCKRLVSSIIRSCVTCRKLRGKLAIQKMSDLPSDRLTPSPPFSFVGVDAFGPWEVVARRTRGGLAHSKRWAIMFTCLTSRAVHIEVIESMSASSFINAMRRLIALRGPVLQFRSDKGSNFVGATNELSSEIESVNVEEKVIQNFLAEKSCVWLFNPPHASHMGGVWERMIGITRSILNSMLMGVSAKNLSHEVLCTLMAEVTAIINGRPLVAVSTDPDFPEVLTPAVLVTQKSSRPFDIGYQSVNPKIQWKHVQALADAFWKRWRSEYLHSLQTRKKWHGIKPNFKVGDVVLLRDKEVHRNNWPLGVINKVFVSDDQKVRKVEVKTSLQGKCQTYIRPISELVLLLSEE